MQIQMDKKRYGAFSLDPSRPPCAVYQEEKKNKSKMLQTRCRLASATASHLSPTRQVHRGGGQGRRDTTQSVYRRNVEAKKKRQMGFPQNHAPTPKLYSDHTQNVKVELHPPHTAALQYTQCAHYRFPKNSTRIPRLQSRKPTIGLPPCPHPPPTERPKPHPNAPLQKRYKTTFCAVAACFGSFLLFQHASPKTLQNQV